MKIKVIYRKNLKMSSHKIEHQVHCAIGLLGHAITHIDNILVEGVSDEKFTEISEFHDCNIQKDLGIGKLKAGTPTAAAWIIPSNKELLDCYLDGWITELKGGTHFSHPTDIQACSSLKFKGLKCLAYELGKKDYEEEASSMGKKTDEQILEEIKNQEPK